MPPDQDRCSASFSHCKGRQCHSPCSDLGRVAYPIYTSSFLWFPCLFHGRKCDLQFSTIQKGSLRRIPQECHSFELRPVIVHRCLNSWGRPKDGSMLQGMLQTSNVLLRLSRHWPEKIAINFKKMYSFQNWRPHESKQRIARRKPIAGSHNWETPVDTWTQPIPSPYWISTICDPKMNISII